MLLGAAVCSSPLPAVHTSTAKVVVLGTSSPFVNTNGWLSDTCLRLTLDTTWHGCHHDTMDDITKAANTYSMRVHANPTHGTSRIPHPLGYQGRRLTQQLLYSQDLRWCSTEESSECFLFKYLSIELVLYLFFLLAIQPLTAPKKTGQTRFGFPLFLCLMQPRHSREKCLSLGNVLVSLLTTWEKDSSAYRCEKICLENGPKKARPSPLLLFQANNRATKKHLYWHITKIII